MDSIIHGIPDQQLRIQATLQHFTDRIQLEYFGSCYGCGSKQHPVASFAGRKDSVYRVEDENYVRLLKFYISNNLSKGFLLECYIDSGSPISLVKKSCLPDNVELDKNVFDYLSLSTTLLLLIFI